MNIRILLLIKLLFLTVSIFSQDNSYQLPDYRCGIGTASPGKFITNSGFDSEFFITLNDTTWMSLPSKKRLYVSKTELGNEFINDFNHVYRTNEGTYFVHSGGGAVLFYDGQVLTRVDDSFYHQNQYGGKSFVYKNELYLFGGQGLFTDKNILTRYDKGLREWVSIDQKGKIPNFNRDAVSIIIDDKVFLLTHQSSLSDDSIKPLLVYQLELNKMTWRLLGQTTLEFSEATGYGFKKIFMDPVSKNLIFTTINGSFIIDFLKNSYRTVKFDYPLERADIFTFNRNQKLIGFYCDNKAQLQNLIISREDFYSKAGEYEELYTANMDLYYSVFLEVLSVILISIVMVILIREIKLDRRIVIRLRNASFIYGLRRLKIFNQHEVDFFIHIAENNNISFQALEELISQTKDSSVTRTKNRERFFRLLNAKLQTIFNLDTNSKTTIIFTHSNPEDKRSKYYSLNPEYFKFM